MSEERTLLETPFAGWIKARGDTIECYCPGRLITALLIFVAAFWSLGIASMVVGGLRDGSPGALIGALVGGVGVGIVVFVIRRRRQRMGHFVLDLAKGELRRLDRRGEAIARRPLEGARLTTRWDPFYRSLIPRHWLLLVFPGGATVRLGHGSKDDALRAKAEIERRQAAFVS